MLKSLENLPELFMSYFQKQGADVNETKHSHKYTTLHFAALSGKLDVVNLLLDHGANSEMINSIGKTASQIGAFVGNHEVVSLINNYIPQMVLDKYFKRCKTPTTVINAVSTAFHGLVIMVWRLVIELLIGFALARVKKPALES
jgi:hypothetical protein